jgi:site-specific recombinase XerD
MTITPALIPAKRTQENVLTLSQLATLCQTPSHLTLPKRSDKVQEVVLLMGFLGLRVSEAINFSWKTKLVADKLAFLVCGKGKKERAVFNVLNNAYIALKAQKKEPDQWTKISRIAIWKYLKRKSRELNLPWTITPHTLRRSFASILHYDFHCEPPAIQQLLGHSQFRTTEHYLKKDTRFLLNSLQRKGFLC